MKKKSYICIVIIVIIVLLCSIKIDCIVLKDLKEDKIILLSKKNEDTSFAVKWIHSVELTPWYEYFEFDEANNVILTKTYFKSFGAGVPDYAGKKTEVKDGYVQFTEINQKIDNLVYGASDIANHEIIIEDNNYILCNLTTPNSPVRIYGDKLSLIKYCYQNIIIDV